jgi:hypothetical protein
VLINSISQFAAGTAPNAVNGWDIATAVGTVGAVVVALVLGLLEQHRAGQRQEDELRRLGEERTRAEADRDSALDRSAREVREQQARRIAIWTEFDLSYGPEGSPDEDTPMITEELVVQNYSDMPIFHVLVAGVHEDESTTLGGIAKVLLPGGELRKPLPSVEIGGNELDQDACYVFFRDVHGRFWTRYSNGDLSENRNRSA